MNRSSYVYVTFIRTTPEKLWEALTDPKFTRQYWLGTAVESAWKQGSPWKLTYADGTVTAPAGAPAVVQEVIAAANQIIDKPYIYGGGHASFTDAGYDCSGAVSYALHGGGLLSAPEDSTELESYGEAGAGQYITTYADASHAFVVIDGLAFDTAHYGQTTPGGTGPRTDR